MSENLWRSLLYIPAHVEKFALKAANSGTDVVILDLEDSVPAIHKKDARALLQSSAELIQQAGAEVAVRINSEEDMLMQDLQAAVISSVSILILPKVETAAFIQSIANEVAKLEKSVGLTAGHISFIALVETPNGLLNAADIAKAHPRLKAINLGTEDFAFEMGMETSWDSLLFPSQQIALAAKAAGIIPLGYAGSIANYTDLIAFGDIAARSAKLGFEGGFAIHPAQIAVLNDAFSPSDAEINKAQRIVEALHNAEQDGLGAISVDGKMVDLPVANRAKFILNRAKVIASKVGTAD